MNRMKSWVRAFFGFSRNETNAFLILLPLMFSFVFIIPVYKAFFTQHEREFSLEQKKLDSLIREWEKQDKKDDDTLPLTQLFNFNPNTSTKNELVSLGFTATMATRLENYRSKGGKFIIKSDLLKLYGMDTALYNSLYSWIDLPIEKPEKISEAKKIIDPDRKIVAEKFDLNLADSSQLIAIYGIGGKLSARIIKYRDLLGGFVSLNQLTEVYGLDTTVIHELKKHSFVLESFEPKRTNLNTATEKELSAHPYISYKIAKAIAAYRFQHGHFKSIDDLTQIAIIDKTTLEKIKPYLTINP